MCVGGRGVFFAHTQKYKKTFSFWFQERRVAQQKEVLKKEEETAEKIAARVFSQQYLAGLIPAVFTALRNHGYFYDPVEKGEPLQLSLFYQKGALVLYECLRGGFSIACFLKQNMFLVLFLQIFQWISSHGSLLRSTTN